jgi:acetate kinase
MTETIQVLNSGGSSIKFQLFEVAERERLERRMKGSIEGIGTRPRFTAKGATGDSREAVVQRLAWLGLELDPAANAGGGPRISREAAPVAYIDGGYHIID